MHSLHTHLLPFVDHAPLHRKMNLQQPWNAPENVPFVAKIMPNWILPGAETPPEDGVTPAETHYEANLRVFGPNFGPTFREIRDGRTNTIGCGEVVSNIRPWADPRNLRDPAIGLNVPGGYGSPWPGGVQLGFMDGSARFVSDKISSEVLRALSTPSGGEPERLYNME